MSWTTLSPGDLAGMSSASGTIQAASDAVAQAAAVAQAVAGATSAVSEVLGGVPDPSDVVKAAIQAVIDTLDRDLSVLVVSPAPLAPPSGLDGFVRTVESSFYDDADPFKPKEGDGSVGGVVFAAYGADLSALSSGADALRALFGDRWSSLTGLSQLGDDSPPYTNIIHAGVVTRAAEDPREGFFDGALAGTSRVPRFIGMRVDFLTGALAGTSARVRDTMPETGEFVLSSRVSADILVNTVYVVNQSRGASPDWEKHSVASVFPSLQRVTSVLRSVKSSIPPTGVASTMSRAVGIVSAAVARRADALSRLSSSLSDLSQILSDLQSVAGLAVLPVPAQPSREHFIRFLLAADGLSDLRRGTYVCGVVLYGGPGPLSALQQVV